MNAVNWKHILVAGSCRGVTAYFFVDSGSAVSIVSTSFVKGLGVESGIRPCDMTLKSFSQDTIQIRGEIELHVIVAGNRFVHTFVVTDLLDTEFLMGDDFLRSNRVTLDYNKCRLMLRNEDSVPFTEKPENVKQQIKVRCSKVTVIPPNTIQYIRGKLQAKGVNFKGLIEPQYRQGVGDTGILFAHAVVHSEKRLVPIKCVNATDEPITIHKNKIIALLKPVGDQEFVHGVQRSRDHEVRVRGTSIDDKTQERRSGVGSIEGEKWTESELFERLGLDEIEVTMSDAEKDRLKRIIWRFRDCFSHDEFDIGCCNMYEAKIKMKEGESPSWTYPIPTPYKLQPEMDRQIDQMVRAGIAEPLKETSDFNHPIFLVKKNTDPESWRLVADLRGANKVCMDEKYPLPNLDHVLDTIGSDSIYSSFDLSKSFWQIPYSEDSKKVTAFMHRGRSYCWARLIMGHKNSSSIFSKVMWKLLATVPIEQLIFFIDDLFLSSKTVSEHLDRLEILLLRLVQANLTLTPKKCMLLREKVTFVGVSISEDGVQITDDRVKDLLALPVPTTVKRVQEVLGALNYVRKWIPRYSVIAKPLHRLTAKEAKFEWTSECQDAFEELKRAVAESTMLAIPDTEDPFQSYHLTVDASKHGYGATLSQEIVRDGKRVEKRRGLVKETKEQQPSQRRRTNLDQRERPPPPPPAYYYNRRQVEKLCLDEYEDKLSRDEKSANESVRRDVFEKKDVVQHGKDLLAASIRWMKKLVREARTKEDVIAIMKFLEIQIDGQRVYLVERVREECQRLVREGKMPKGRGHGHYYSDMRGNRKFLGWYVQESKMLRETAEQAERIPPEMLIAGRLGLKRLCTLHERFAVFK